MQLPFCIIAFARFMVFSKLHVSTATSVSTSTEDPCPVICACSKSMANPKSVDALCMVSAIDENTDFRSFNQTSFPSQMKLYCQKKENKSSTLKDGIFESLHAFSQIEIRDCHLTVVSRYAFRGMNSLTNLLIAGGKNTHFDNGCLQLPELANLQTVSILESNISSAPSLCNLPNLRKINLTRNNIRNFSNSGLMCQRPRPIEVIDISENCLANLPERFEEVTGKLQQLYASRNRIHNISATIFETLTSLKIIDLKENHISLFPQGVLGNNTKIDTLQLAHNSVGCLPQGIFDKLENLSFLNLDAMDLNNDIWYELQNLTGLKKLLLNDNNIQSIHIVTMRKLNNLELFTLSGNNINIVSNGTFESQSEMVLLNLSRNNIKSIESNSLSDLLKLETLDLKQNQILTFHDDAVNMLVYLRQLDLSYNHLERVPKLPVSLDDLNLSNNNISLLFDTTFSGLNTLFRLNLASNHIKYLPPNAFTTNINLHVLKLAFNNIYLVSSSIFPRNSNLQHLDLQYNDIQYIEFANEYFPFLASLDLSHNNIEWLIPGLRDVFPDSIQ